MTKNQKAVVIGAVVFIALAGTAVGASYLTRQSVAEEKQVAEAQPKPVIHHRVNHQAAQANNMQPAAGPACNDHNIVGTLVGGAAGGIAGHQIGKGTGKTVATIGGAAGGAYLGNEYINTRNATCN